MWGLLNFLCFVKEFSFKFENSGIFLRVFSWKGGRVRFEFCKDYFGGREED